MNRIPLPLKIAVTGFTAVLVPYYWATYTPWNFLYFCDVALLLTVVALWTESRFLTSMQAVGILAPQALWVADLLTGARLTGMTTYMFNADLPFFVRGLSSFHGWLPFVLVFLLIRLGYDRRAFPAQAALAVGLLVFCYAIGPVGPAPADFPNHAVNINYVFGMDDAAPQTMMSPLAWLGLMIAVNVGGFILPSHLVLRWLAARRMIGGAWHAPSPTTSAS